MTSYVRLGLAHLLALVLASCSAGDPASLAYAPKPIAQLAPIPGLKVRPLTDRTFERTEARRARGEYLAEGILACAACHSERDWQKPGGPIPAGRAYAGRVWKTDGKTWLVAPNITPEPHTGAGRWSDDMLARAIREGIGHDGRLLHPQMWYRSFRLLSDEDLASVVVYLRSLPAVRNTLPQTVLSDEQVKRYVGEPRPITAPVPEPTHATPEERGRYLAGLADCGGCHTLWDGKRLPGAFAGGNEVGRDGRTVFSANITPDPTGMSYDAAGFIQVIRTGKAGLLAPEMPWLFYRRLNDADLTALHAFLKTRYPVSHRISNLGPGTACAVCGGQHPLGSANRLLPVRGIAVPERLLRDYVGSYRIDEYDWTLRIELLHGKLHMVDGEAPPKELVALTQSRFAMDGGLGPLRFERDGEGRVARVVSEDVEDVPLERIAEVAAKAGGSP
jgi:mono/diheme cytochrome c family protein